MILLEEGRATVAPGVGSFRWIPTSPPKRPGRAASIARRDRRLDGVLACFGEPEPIPPPPKRDRHWAPFKHLRRLPTNYRKPTGRVFLGLLRPPRGLGHRCCSPTYCLRRGKNESGQGHVRCRTWRWRCGGTPKCVRARSSYRRVLIANSVSLGSKIRYRIFVGQTGRRELPPPGRQPSMVLGTRSCGSVLRHSFGPAKRVWGHLVSIRERRLRHQETPLLMTIWNASP